MNSARLRDLIANVENANVEEERIRYATERFLKRLEKSEYHKNFVLKGGFLLGLIYDVSQRTTKDLDALVENIDVNKKNIEKIITEIINVDLKDGVYYNLTKIYETQNEREYKGLRVNLVMYFSGEKTRIDFSLDIGVGDVVEPAPILKEFLLRFNESKGENEKVKLLSYTKESIFSEKLETILRLGAKNTRIKDFYDIDLILRDKDIPKKEKLYLAFKRTWENRHPNIEIDQEVFLDWMFIVKEDIKNSEQMKLWWRKYIKDREYANKIDFEEIVANIEKIVNEFYTFFRKNSI